MSIYWPYEVFVGSDVLAFSFELPNAGGIGMLPARHDYAATDVHLVRC
jgi:hypothetical protein